MRSDAVDVAVVGGGFSRTMAAVHLARRGVDVRLLERRAEPAGGIDCGTPSPIHVLTAAAVPELGDEDGKMLLVGTEDRVATPVWALGPLTKGMYWEMRAVPDIRGQAERIALAIVKELKIHG